MAGLPAGQEGAGQARPAALEGAARALSLLPGRRHELAQGMEVPPLLMWSSECQPWATIAWNNHVASSPRSASRRSQTGRQAPLRPAVQHPAQQGGETRLDRQGLVVRSPLALFRITELPQALAFGVALAVPQRHQHPPTAVSAQECATTIPKPQAASTAAWGLCTWGSCSPTSAVHCSKGYTAFRRAMGMLLSASAAWPPNPAASLMEHPFSSLACSHPIPTPESLSRWEHNSRQKTVTWCCHRRNTGRTR